MKEINNESAVGYEFTYTYVEPRSVCYGCHIEREIPISFVVSRDTSKVMYLRVSRYAMGNKWEEETDSQIINDAINKYGFSTETNSFFK